MNLNAIYDVAQACFESGPMRPLFLTSEQIACLSENATATTEDQKRTLAEMAESLPLNSSIVMELTKPALVTKTSSTDTEGE